MAWSNPALCKAVFAANGTNNYVLQDPSNQGPYRTDAQAVADGSLVTGTTIHYVAWRTTTTGDAEFEEGYGTYTSASRTVTRTAGNVIDSDGGAGVLRDWGLSGQVDLSILDVLDGSNIPDKAAYAATLLNDLTLLGIGTASPDELLHLRGDTPALRIESSNEIADVAGTEEIASIEFEGVRNNLVAVSAKIVARQDSASWSGANINQKPTRLEFCVEDTNSASALATPRLTIKNDGLVLIPGGARLSSGGAKFVTLATGGTVGMVFTTAPPTGWTRVNQSQSRVIRLAKSGDTVGATGGSDDIFDGAWVTAGHTLTINEIPSHTHAGIGQGFVYQDLLNGSLASPGAGTALRLQNATASAGSDQAHAHAMTLPYYKIYCEATYD